MLIAGWSSRLHPIDSDEGVVLNGAWNLVHGRTLYVDFFEYVGPGAFYALDAAWRVLGSGYTISRALGIALALAAAAGVVALGRQIDPHRPAYGPALLLFGAMNAGPLVNHNAFAVAPAVWAVHLAIAGLRSGRRAVLAASGALCACTLLTLQHKGFALGAALALTIAITTPAPRGRGIVGSLAAFGAGAVPVIGLVLRWPVSLLGVDLIVFPLTRYAAVQDASPWELVIFAAVCAWVFAGLRGRIDATAGRALVIVQTALLAACIPRPDTMHIVWAAFPVLAAYPLFAAALPWSSAPPDRRRVRPRVLVRVSISASACAFVATMLATGLGQAARSDRAREELLAVVRDACGPSPTIYAGPFLPGLYYETGVLAPTRYSILIEGINSEEQFAEARAALERAPPSCVIHAPAMARKYGHRGGNPVDQYVAAEYRARATLGNVSVMTRSGE